MLEGAAAGEGEQFWKSAVVLVSSIRREREEIWSYERTGVYCGESWGRVADAADGSDHWALGVGESWVRDKACGVKLRSDRLGIQFSGSVVTGEKSVAEGLRGAGLTSGSPAIGAAAAGDKAGKSSFGAARGCAG